MNRETKGSVKFLPSCPKHSEEMVKVKSTIEYIGSGWERKLIYVEEYLCPTCKFRAKAHFLVLEWGEAFGSKFNPSLLVVNKNE